MTFKDIQQILKRHNVKLLKSLGQTFLVDKTAIKKFFGAANIKPNETILEIGPGIGNLTCEIAKRAKKVIAVEKDQRMINILKETLKNLNNVEVIHSDALTLKRLNYKVVANLPFYASLPIIRMFLESGSSKEMVLIIQKEVAQKICAKPPKSNFLATSVQFFSNPKIISHISKKSFFPQPKTDSSIIHITPTKKHIKQVPEKLFFKIIKAGFLHPRKQLANNLAKELKLEKEDIQNWLFRNSISPSQRAESLRIKDWVHLSKTL